jgi:hypothetical protein
MGMLRPFLPASAPMVLRPVFYSRRQYIARLIEVRSSVLMQLNHIMLYETNMLPTTELLAKYQL